MSPDEMISIISAAVAVQSEAFIEIAKEQEGRIVRLECEGQMQRFMISQLARHSEKYSTMEKFEELLMEASSIIEHDQAEVVVIKGDDIKKTVDDIILRMKTGSAKQ